MMTLYPFQNKLLNDARAALSSGYHSPLIVSPTGSGKCFGRGTKILMFDGTIKNVEDIRRGDLLMGPDSSCRKVESTCSGIDELYKIIPTKGDPYVVNESHILSLKITPDHKRGGTVCGMTIYHDNEIANVMLIDYLKSSKTFRHRAKGWRTGVNFKESMQPEIDPYFLGLWLGDGNSRTSMITTGDKEIKEYLNAFSESINHETRIEYNSEHSENIYIKGEHRTGRGGTGIMNVLRKYDLIQNKHIPHAYKTASREIRLRILAGIIDTDGYYSNSGYDLTLKSEQLFDDVLFLCRSLGFACYKSKVKKTCTNNGKSGLYYRCNINGDLSDVPCLIKRKQADERRQKKNHLVHGIKIEPAGHGEYFGFTISGPDRLFLLGDFTVVHNTVIFSEIARGAMAKKNRVLILVHRKEILEQTLQKLYLLGVQAGQVASGKPNTRDMIQVAMVKTLHNRLRVIRKPDLIIIDEAHHSVANQWHEILDFFPDVPRLGFTATPERMDGAGLRELYDTMILGPSINELVNNDYLSYPAMYRPPDEIAKAYHVKRGDFDVKEQEQTMTKKSIVGDVIEHYKKYMDRLPAVCFCVSLDHCRQMEAAFNAAGYRAKMVFGNMPSPDRERAIKGLADGSIHIITSCDVISEGVDVPVMAGAILLRRTLSLGLYLQQVGRALRKYPGKEHAVILDHAGNYHIHGHVLADREWSLDAGKRNNRQIRAPQTTSCPRCFAIWPGMPRKCPECGFSFSDNPDISAQQRKTPEQIAGELIAALPEGVSPAQLRSLTGFVNRIQTFDAKTRQRAMIAKAAELQRGEIDALAKAVGYKPGWTHFVWTKVLNRRA
jgi:superfamily II DNA or RNA helicase